MVPAVTSRPDQGYIFTFSANSVIFWSHLVWSGLLVSSRTIWSLVVKLTVANKLKLKFKLSTMEHSNEHVFETLMNNVLTSNSDDGVSETDRSNVIGDGETEPTSLLSPIFAVSRFKIRAIYILLIYDLIAW